MARQMMRKTLVSEQINLKITDNTVSVTTCELNADKQGESKQNFWSSCVVFTEEERGQKRKRDLDEEGEEDDD